MIFIDTGAFIARYLRGDSYHKDSLIKWQEIKEQREKCCVSNFVLNETLTLLGRWVNYDFAAEKAELIYASSAFTILRADRNDEIAAIALFKKFADQAISFTDCISAVLMKNEKITQVFSFDRHFLSMGFSLY